MKILIFPKDIYLKSTRTFRWASHQPSYLSLEHICNPTALQYILLRQKIVAFIVTIHEMEVR